uniref:Reverse transcriptase domain-containing protein n=1 Tax=Anabas testudineus TaxID=64144 RepID=A0AAQ6IQI3_ANATE
MYKCATPACFSPDRSILLQFATTSAVQLLALTETWITPQITATPAALSTGFAFSHTPRPSRRGGGTGLLVTDTWKFFTMAPFSNLSSLEYHAVRITAPITAHIIVIYRPPDQLGDFCDELDMLLSQFPEDGTPLIVLGHLNIHLDKPQASDVLALLNTFDLRLVSTPPTHKAGNNLNLVLIRNCTVDDISVTPLHLSDHFFIQLTVFISRPSHSSTALETFRRNLRSLNPDQLSFLVSAALPSSQVLSTYDTDAARDRLCDTLSFCLDSLCLTSTRPPSASNSWLTDQIREQRTVLRSAERKWRKSKSQPALTECQDLLQSFSYSVTRAKTEYYQDKLSNTTDTRKLFSTFKSLLYPPPPPPPTCLTADDFASFFTNKVAAISSQFTPPDNDILLTKPDDASHFTFSTLSEDNVSTLLLSNRPTTCSLDPITSSLLQAIAPTLIPAITQIINTSVTTGTFPTSFKQAQITPLLKKPSLDPSLVENYRPVSLLSFLAKTLERAAFNQLSDFLSRNNLLDVNQSGFKSGHSTETALLTVVESLRVAKAAGKSSVLILLDLSAAFDTVNHQILMTALSDLGISGSALNL